MRPSEALAALAANDHTALIIDRRVAASRRLKPAGLVITDTFPLGSDQRPVIAHIAVAPDQRSLPRSLYDGPRESHMRVMDRFYVPVQGDPLVTQMMFDLISDLYDNFTDRAVNLHTAEQLLRAVLDKKGDNAVVLDFGCGTGIARDALRRIGATSATLIGTDLSDRMLGHAAARGEPVMTIEEWRATERKWDGVIASFVLHYGVAAADLRLIAHQLTTGGIFAANFFKANQRDLDDLTGLLKAEGLSPIALLELATHTRATNRAVVFEKVCE